MRDKAYDKVQIHQEKKKNTFDRKVKDEQFQIDDLVLKWMLLEKAIMEIFITCG